MALFPALMFAYGAYQTIRSEAELRKLEKEDIPQYSLGPTSQKLVDMADIGYTPQETAVFYDQLNRNEMNAYRTTMERVGNTFAGAAWAGINSKKFTAIAKFVNDDASLHRLNLRTAANIEQSIKNKNTDILLKDYFGRQQGWGKAKEAGINNMFLAGALASSTGAAKGGADTGAFKELFSENPAKAATGAIVGGATAKPPGTEKTVVQKADALTSLYNGTIKLDNGSGGTNLPGVGYKSKKIQTEGVSTTDPSNYGPINFNDYGAIFDY